MMKKLLCLLLFVFCASGVVFAQQIIWTTDKEPADKSVRIIPVKSVKAETLKLSNKYEYYYNFTGSDKRTFIKEFGNDWSWVTNISDFVAIALLTEVEGYSMVFVLLINGSDVDMLVFTDVYEEGALIIKNDKKKLGTLMDDLLKKSFGA